MSRVIKRILFFLMVMTASTITAYSLTYTRSLLRFQVISELAQTYHDQFAQILKRTNIDQQLASAVTYVTPTPTSAQIVRHPLPSPIVIRHVSEEDLWNALTAYRQAHQRTPLIHEDPLCVYGRLRVSELLSRLETLLPEDGPLDGHAGFERDAKSGKVFKDTGFSAVAENLAFLPSYASATQVIEWGWDSSSAHRNAQLSDEWTHGCIVGTYPIYVGIFGQR